MRILIFTGGTARQGKAVKKIVKQKFDVIIAADQGAREAFNFEIIPHMVIGDLDSLDKQTLKKVKQIGIRIIKFPKEKNKTDTELALIEALKQNATEIIVIGGIEGSRIDHLFANIFLLKKYNLVPICFINGNQMAWLNTTGKIFLKATPGDLLSLIPITEDVLNIYTKGLQYALNNETLFFGETRGISNVFIASKAEITFKKGPLLLVQTIK